MNRKRSFDPKVLVKPLASDMRSVRQRASLVAVIIGAAFCAMVYRSIDIAIYQHEPLQQRGNGQQLRAYSVDASRGTIFDRNGVAMAVSDQQYLITVSPKVFAHRDANDPLATRLRSELRSIGGAELLEKFDNALTHTSKAYRRLDYQITTDQRDHLAEIKHPGVGFEPSESRVYPRGHLASHIVGRVSKEGRGNLGLEYALDDLLSGRETQSPAYFASHPGGSRRLLINGSPDPAAARGHSVELTIDSTIQSFAEQELAKLVEAWHPVGASVVILEPSTGEILGLANLPTFDPNRPVKATNDTVNLAVQGAYEPGSTLKAITVAAALESGTIRKNQVFDCKNGSWQYTPKHRLHDTKRAGILDVTHILAVSSNICTTQIYETLGKERLYEWIRRFHFGERPHIQLPGAARGLLADWQKWPDIQAANISFGQGMTASPLQVAAAFAALANRGVYVHPTIVRKISSADGEVVWQHEPEEDRVVRESTAATVLEMLESVVHDSAGTGKNAVVPGYRVAGKTSTAQKAGPRGGYLEDQYYASFVGAIPAKSPRVVILVSVDNPEGGHYGNQVAAPTFSRVAARMMTYLGVPPQEDAAGEAVEQQPLVSIVDHPRDQAASAIDPEEPPLPGGDEPRARYTTGLPDFRGMTLQEAIIAARRSRIALRVHGTGLATSQSLEPGPVAAGTTVDVQFAPPV